MKKSTKSTQSAQIDMDTIRKFIESNIKLYDSCIEGLLIEWKTMRQYENILNEIYTFYHMANARIGVYRDLCEEIELGSKKERTSMIEMYQQLLNEKHENNLRRLKELEI